MLSFPENLNYRGKLVIFFWGGSRLSLPVSPTLYTLSLVEDSSNTGRCTLNTMTVDLQIPEIFKKIIEYVVIGVSVAVTHTLGNTSSIALAIDNCLALISSHKLHEHI